MKRLKVTENKEFTFSQNSGFSLKSEFWEKRQISDFSHFDNLIIQIFSPHNPDFFSQETDFFL